MKSFSENEIVESGVRNPDDIVKSNLEYVSRAQASALERKFSHIKDRAGIIASEIKKSYDGRDIMCAVFRSEKAAEIYENKKGREGHFYQYFDKANAKEAKFFWETYKKTDYLYMCKCIAHFDGNTHTVSDILRWLSSDPSGNMFLNKREKKISFVRGNQLNRAFECFARFVPGVMAEYEENFDGACAAVADSETDYAILPVENSVDGRLNGFYRLIEKYGLSIVLSVNIVSDDGENTTKFALLYKDFEIIDAPGELLFECRMSFDNQEQIGDITSAADYFGAEIKKVYSLPSSAVGMDNLFDMIFRIDKADFAGFFCYLMLEYPRFTTVGVYIMTEGEKE